MSRQVSHTVHAGYCNERFDFKQACKNIRDIFLNETINNYKKYDYEAIFPVPSDATPPYTVIQSVLSVCKETGEKRPIPLPINENNSEYFDKQDNITIKA